MISSKITLHLTLLLILY